MIIRFMGPGTRLVGRYEWSWRTKMVQDVDAETAAQVLTQPGETFEVDESEPLLQLEGLGAERAALLALCGIGSAAELAGIKAKGIAAVARTLGVGPLRVKVWKKEAGTLTHPAPTLPLCRTAAAGQASVGREERHG